MNATIFLAEEVEKATFDRLNLHGCIPGGRIVVPEFPYQLQTNIVGMITVPNGIEGAFQPTLSIRFAPDGGPYTDWEDVQIPSMKATGERRMVIAAPMRWWLFGPGRMETRISLSGATCAFEWTISSGYGPSKGVGAPTISATILGANANSFDVCALAASATTELAIVDPYLSPVKLVDLINRVPTTTRIRVLIPPKDADAYQAEKARLIACHPKIELMQMAGLNQRGPIHDRFVFVNGEVYWFGTSLKDVMSGRVTRVAKIFGHEEARTVTDIFESEWTAGTRI